MTYRSLASTIFILYLCLNRLAGAVPNSVCNEPGFYSLRPCAQSCVGCDPSPDQIAFAIGCGNVPPNECWCRTNLFALATSGLNSCISQFCTVGGWEPDYSGALSFYTSYCQKSGFTAVADAPADVIATTTAVIESTIIDAGAPTVTNIVITTKDSASKPTITTRKVITIDATSTAPADSGVNEGNGSARSGLSLSDKIALGVGIGVGLPATIAALVSCCILMSRRS